MGLVQARPRPDPQLSMEKFSLSILFIGKVSLVIDKPRASAVTGYTRHEAVIELEAEAKPRPLIPAVSSNRDSLRFVWLV